MLKVIVTIPAYNAARTIANLITEIPPDTVDELLLVDDGSTDATLQIARQLGIPSISHGRNLGYGANQKTCYTAALNEQADIIVMLHGDNQYSPDHLPAIIEPIKQGQAQLVFGSRMLEPGSARRGGMPLYKRLSNRLLTRLANLLLGTSLTDAHSGYRAFSRHFLTSVPWQNNDDRGYGFDPQILIQAVHFKQSIVEVSIPSRYFPEAHTPKFLTSVKYGFKFISLLIKYHFHDWHLLKLSWLQPPCENNQPHNSYLPSITADEPAPTNRAQTKRPLVPAGRAPQPDR